jgi:hypothetical protein
MLPAGLFRLDCLFRCSPVKGERVSGGKCNFGPVFGQLYIDGFTDSRAAASYQVTLSFNIGERSPRCH